MFLATFLVFLAASLGNGVRAIVGFGGALIIVPLITMIHDLPTAAPTVALSNLLPTLYVVYHYWHGVRWATVLRMTVGIVIGTPVGVYLLGNVDSGVMLLGLGIFIVLYTAYTMLGPELPVLKGHFWDPAFGLIGGMIGGAFNMSGPPYIVYGTMSRWPAAEFKATLSMLFFLGAIVVTVSHYSNGNLTPLVWQSTFAAIPGGLVGTYVGLRIGDRLDAETFRKIVFAVLFVIGANLIRLGLI